MFAKALIRGIAFLVLSAGFAAGVQAAAPAAATAVPLTPMGAGDTFRMTVVGRPEMDGTITVSDDGTAPIPYVDPVRISGLSPVDAQKKIAQALKDNGIFNDPQVTVTPILSRSQRVTVSGEVNAPGLYEINSRTMVLDALAQAGGAKSTAASIGYILRDDAAGVEQRLPVRLRGSMAEDPSSPTRYLRPGDKLIVPEAERIYITGEVKNGGVFKWEPEITVQQAIALAGGKTDIGSMKRIEITRKDKNGKMKSFKVKPDDLVQPNDQILVKPSML